MKQKEKRVRKITEPKPIGQMLLDTKFKEIVNCTKLELVAKHSTIFSFWHEVVGKKFANYTKIQKIKNNKIFVSAKSPVIIQELNLYKEKILKKLNSYSYPLGIEIKEIVFDYKNFNVGDLEKSFNEDNLVEDKPLEVSKCTLDNINIEQSTLDNIKKHIQTIKFLDEKQKEKLYNNAVTALKIKTLKNNEY